MKRAIVGFRRDEAGEWIARLDCGHGQHVRHRPPFVNRPWAASAAGREGMIGGALDCARCDRMEWPDGLAAYRRTPEFDEATLPAGLKAEHATRVGTWGRIRVLSGVLRYSVGAPVGRSFRLDPAAEGIVVPQVPHRVAPEGPVRFFVEFWRMARPE